MGSQDDDGAPTPPPKHPTKIPGWALEHLAREVASLRYDALAEFLDRLAFELDRDATNNFARDRPWLGTSLGLAAESLGSAVEDIGAAWRVCQPHEEVGP